MESQDGYGWATVGFLSWSFPGVSHGTRGTAKICRLCAVRHASLNTRVQQPHSGGHVATEVPAYQGSHTLTRPVVRYLAGCLHSASWELACHHLLYTVSSGCLFFLIYIRSCTSGSDNFK